MKKKSDKRVGAFEPPETDMMLALCTAVTRRRPVARAVLNA